MDRSTLEKTDALCRIMRATEVLPSGCWHCHLGGRNAYSTLALTVSPGLQVTVYSHRVIYTLLVDPIPPALTLDHLCRRPHCVNPSHLDRCRCRSTFCAA